ncbi:MAG: hypothetical protein ACOCZM_01335 [Bacillota bacterium]
MGDNGEKSGVPWLIWMAVLIVSAYMIPYGFIGDRGEITASFAYWCLFGLLAVVTTIRITGFWRDE